MQFDGGSAGPAPHSLVTPGWEGSRACRERRRTEDWKRGWLWLWLLPSAGILILFLALVAAPVFGWQARAGSLVARAWISSADAFPHGMYSGVILYDQGGALRLPLGRCDRVFTLGSWHWCISREFSSPEEL